MPPLMAKSGEVREETTLVGHTKCVLAAVDALFVDPDGGPSRLARSWLRFFGLKDEGFPRFRRHLRVAAAAHDWGKANDGFQAVIEHQGEQAVYHEHLSGVLLSEGAVLEWLRRCDLDEIVVLSAVLTHHVRCGPKTLGTWRTAARTNLRVLSDHDDFGALWSTIQAEVGSLMEQRVRFPRLMTDDEFEGEIEVLKARLNRERSRLRDDPGRISWIAAVRSALIVCDAVGSAVTRLPGEIEGWIRDAFSGQLTRDFAWREVIKKRLADLRKRDRWDDSQGVSFGDEPGFTEFQRDVASKGPRVLLTAPCGSGKTLAAWNWICAQLRERTATRAIFLYPTRATATEGFRDYVSWAPEADASLLTGTSGYDLQGLFASPDDPRHERKYGTSPRLFSLGHWNKRIFSATADQFFPFLQFGYGPLCLLPLLAEAVVVVDEVHSYDKSMFATLKRFLQEFPSVPVLCMTATLPVERRKVLVEECGLTAFPDPPPADLAIIAEHPRYRVEWVEREAVESLARKALDMRQRVLWVSNRVDDCRTVFDIFHEDPLNPGAVPTFCYHSRFKLDHRRAHHNEVVTGFQAAARDLDKPSPIFAATTQVCEMSLDLDADVLVTELAPIASIIQRMGRCNRDSKAMRDRKRIGRVFVVRPVEGKEKPYEKAELAAAEQFVDDLIGRDVSQCELERLYEKHDPPIVEPDKLCPFLDSGPYAQAREESFRDGDEFTVPCVLDDDLPKVLGSVADRLAIDGYIVPAPSYLSREAGPGQSSLPRWLRIAEGSRYNANTGFDGRPRPKPDGDSDS